MVSVINLGFSFLSSVQTILQKPGPRLLSKQMFRPNAWKIRIVGVSRCYIHEKWLKLEDTWAAAPMLSAQTAEPEGNLTFTKPGRSHWSHLGGSYAHRSARNIRAPQKPDRSSAIQSQKAFNPTFGQTSRKSSCSPCNTSFLRKESGWPDRKISVADLIGNAFMKSHLLKNLPR